MSERRSTASIVPMRPPSTHHSLLFTLCSLLGVVLWVVSLALATLGYVVGRTVYERGAVYSQPGPAIPDLDGPQRAINTQLELEPDEAAQRRSLSMIRAAGFGWIRQPFPWADIEAAGK